MYDYVLDEVERQNALTSLKDGLLFSIMSGLTGPFWGAFALGLGASDFLLALLTSLPAAVGLLAQVPSALLVDRHEDRLKPTLIFAVAHRVFYLAFAVLALLPCDAKVKAWAFVILYAAMNFPATTVGIAWTALVGELFSPKLRGKIFGDRNMMCTLTTLLCTGIAGPFLDSVAWPLNYSLIYTGSFCAVMGSVYYLAQHRVPSFGENQAVPKEKGMKSFRRVMEDRKFLRFTGASLAIHVGFHVPASLWTILYVREMGLGNSWLGAFSVASSACSFLSYRSWGRWCTDHGNLKSLAWAAGGHALFPVMYAYLRSPGAFLIYSCLGGFLGAGFGLAIFNLLLDNSPAQERPAYIALYNMALGVSGVIWPFVGVWLYGSLGMNSAMNASFVLRLLGLTASFFLVKEDLLRPQESSN